MLCRAGHHEHELIQRVPGVLGFVVSRVESCRSRVPSYGMQLGFGQGAERFSKTERLADYNDYLGC